MNKNIYFLYFILSYSKIFSKILLHLNPKGRKQQQINSRISMDGTKLVSTPWSLTLE